MKDTHNYVNKAWMVTPEQWEKLRKLAFKAGKSQSELIREAIEMILKKYKAKS